MQVWLRTALVSLFLTQIQRAIAFDSVDDFLVMDQVSSPADFSSNNGSGYEPMASIGIGEFDAERIVQMRNNTIGFPEASVDIGATTESQLTFSMDRIGAEQSAGWMRLGVAYRFPDPLDAFADRTKNDSILVSLDFSGTRPPPMQVSIQQYSTWISGEELLELAALHDGFFTVSFNVNDLVDRSGIAADPSFFDSVRYLSVGFLHHFDGSTDGTWRASIRELGPGLGEPVPEASTLILGAMASFGLLGVRVRQ